MTGSKTEAQRRAENKYHREKLHIVSIKYTRADYEEIARAAAEAGEPVATFARRAISARIAENRKMFML